MKALRKLLLPILLVLIIGKNYAQSTMTLAGQIVTPNSEPVAFAHVYIKGKTMGGTSDLEGKFRFHISDEYLDDQLAISYVGFKKLEIPVKELAENPNLVIQLEVNVINLDDVVVYDSRSVLADALRDIEKDLSQSQYYKRFGVLSFSRKEDQHYSLLEEIAFNLYWRGARGNSPSIDYEPIAQRRSIDYSAKPVIGKGGKNIITTPADMFGMREVSNLPKTIQSLDSLDLNITDIVKEDGQTFHVITQLLKSGKTKNYYISPKKAQLRKIEIISNPKVGMYYGNKALNSSKYTLSKYRSIKVYYFEKKDMNYELSKITYTTKSQFIERSTGYIRNAYRDQYMITFLSTEYLREKPKKYKSKFFHPFPMEYNAVFWENLAIEYNLGITSEVSSSLGKRKPLSEQFETTNGEVLLENTFISSSFNKKDLTRQSNIEDISNFIHLLKTNAYNADYPPNLAWDDIPSLLEIANAELIIDRFPRNILSSWYLEECQLGIVAMWLIDSIRKNEGGKPKKGWYISPMALLQNGNDRKIKNRYGGVYIPRNSTEKMQTAYDAFRTWWLKAKTNKSKLKRISPLETCELNWMWN